MKVVKNDNGFEISARDFNHFYRFFILNIFYDIPILIIIFLVFNDKEMIIICFIALLIGELIGFFSDRYYLVNLKVKGDFFEAIFSPNNKKVLFESKISNLDFKLTK